MPVGGALASTFSPQLQVQQAQRAADLAEQKARALRVKAQDAQAQADHEQEYARQWQVRSDQAQQEAGSARQGVAELRSLHHLQAGYQEIRQQIQQVVAPSSPAAPPVVNSEGQLTGTLVNATA